MSFPPSPSPPCLPHPHSVIRSFVPFPSLLSLPHLPPPSRPPPRLASSSSFPDILHGPIPPFSPNSPFPPVVLAPARHSIPLSPVRYIPPLPFFPSIFSPSPPVPSPPSRPHPPPPHSPRLYAITRSSPSPRTHIPFLDVHSSSFSGPRFRLSAHLTLYSTFPDPGYRARALRLLHPPR
ncbi:hypothetical protein DFH09DRAFT_1381323 [Mycena vulgaris]|nr:hypothetical protein DFH09DRAFT_1381323 [Mycena vulgaris]